MNKPHNIIGTPPDKESIYKILFAFVEDVTTNFKPFSKNTKGNDVDSENLITQDFEKILNSRSRAIKAFFAFQNQHEEGQYVTDISVYNTTSYDDFCWIEAKRLPTPDGGKTRDEREYVIVSQEKENGKKKFKGNGGIQRFKEGKHAPKHSYAIMIGYIQQKDATYWLNKINGWISELMNKKPNIWTESDYLHKQDTNNNLKYSSVHNRSKGLGKITLQHFWINV